MTGKNRSEIARDVSVAGYVLIRKYVVDQVLLCGQEPKRISSMRELAARFSVASSTVQKALKDLIADGFLVVKPGIGMFTNPDYGWTDARPEVVELLLGDGRQIYFQYTICTLTGEIARCITATDRVVHFTDLFHRNSSAIAEISPDTRGMVWVSPYMSRGGPVEEFVRQVKIPIVVLGGHRAGFSSVDFDHEEEGYQLAEALLKEDRRHIVFFSAEDSQASGIRRAFRDAGESADRIFHIDPRNQITKEFAAHLDAHGAPDAICDFNGKYPQIRSLLQQRNIDCVRKCRIVVAGRKLPFPHWRFSLDYSPLCDMALELLNRQIAEPDREPEFHCFVRKLERFETEPFV